MVNYKCNTCKHVFNQKSNYDKHINKKNKCTQVIINTLQCIYCDGIFIQHKELISHIKYNCSNKLILLQNKIKKEQKKNEKIFIKLHNEIDKLKKQNILDDFNPLQCIHCLNVLPSESLLVSHIKYNCNKLILLKKENKELNKKLNSICAGMLIKQI